MMSMMLKERKNQKEHHQCAPKPEPRPDLFKQIVTGRLGRYRTAYPRENVPMNGGCPKWGFLQIVQCRPFMSIQRSSKMGGAPKSSTFIGFSMNHLFWGNRRQKPPSRIIYRWLPLTKTWYFHVSSTSISPIVNLQESESIVNHLQLSSIYHLQMCLTH